jgi:sugar lactone lactonase YvrE
VHISTLCKQISVHIQRWSYARWAASLALAFLAVKPVLAQVPAVVATSTTTFASGFSAGPAVTDACGNVYVYEGGGTGVVQISASTGAVTVVVANAQGYPSSGQALYMDAAKANLYFPDFGNFYSTHFDQLPITNCTPGGLNTNFANNLGNLGNYYWGTVMDAAGDAAGNVYFTTTANVTQAIYKETYSSTANTYTDSQILTWTNNINHIAADAAGNVYFVDNTTQNVYKMALSGTTYGTPTVFVPASNFESISGLSLDPQGNLYITDVTANLVFEVPNVGGSLVPADLYATASVGVPFKVGVDADHNIYLSNYYPGAAKVAPGSAIAPATAVGATSGSFALNYVFNSSTTPTAITGMSGTSTTTPFSIAAGVTGSCAVGTVQASLSTCAINVTFTPKAAGTQSGAINFGYAAGSIVSAVSGVGKGSAVTIDPGSVIPSTTTFTAPSGVAVDNLGDVFVTDTTANTVTEFAAGSAGVGTTVSTGSLKLSAPKGVALDSAGDIFIADTGNNRIVEIPVVAGVLTNASAFAFTQVLKAPQGVAVDAGNDLLIADTGDNNLLFVPNINGSLSFAAAQSFGTSLKGPDAIAVDLSGNVFLAESGNNDVLKFSGPLGSAAQVKVASGFSTPTGVAVDASGSLFVVDSGSGSIFRYSNVNGLLGTKTLVGVSVVSPVGVATDASGNLYVTDTTNDLFAEIGRVAGTLQFGGVNVGSAGTETGAVNNSGNLPLVFQKPDYAVNPNPAAGFAVTADNCSGATVAPGSACSITATYTPTAPQLNAEEDLTLAANGNNGTPVVKLIGTGAHITPSTVTLVLTSPAGATSLNAGQAATFTATIGTGTNTAVAGGSVKFFVNGSQVGTVAVKNGTAAITLNNGLPFGPAVQILAQYTGDVINYSGSQGSLTEDVIALGDTLGLAVTAPWNNPLSANDNAANAAGPAVTLTATLTLSSTIAPGGTVTFYAGTSILGIVSVTPSTSGIYSASLVPTTLRAGTTNPTENGSYLTNYTLSAVYSGDTTYLGAASASAPIAIVGANTAANLTNTTGATFTITPSSPTITVSSTGAAGQVSGSATLTVTSYGGWSGVLNFTCSGLPAYATCNPFPGAPLVIASTPSATLLPTTVNFVINTNVPPIVPTASSLAWWGAGLGGLLMLLFRQKLRKQGRMRYAQLLSLAGVLLLLGGSMAGLTACSSTATNHYVTPAGTSQVKVTVAAAQNVPATTTGQVEPQDINVPPVTITLVVQ